MSRPRLAWVIGSALLGAFAFGVFVDAAVALIVTAQHLEQMQ